MDVPINSARFCSVFQTSIWTVLCAISSFLHMNPWTSVSTSNQFGFVSHGIVSFPETSCRFRSIFWISKKISTDNNKSTYSLVLMHEFDKNIRQNPLLCHPNVLKIMLHLHSKNWLEPLNGPKHKNHWSSWSLISLTYSLIYSFLLFLIYSVIKSGNSNIRLAFISSYCLFLKKQAFYTNHEWRTLCKKFMAFLFD